MDKKDKGMLAWVVCMSKGTDEPGTLLKVLEIYNSMAAVTATVKAVKQE